MSRRRTPRPQVPCPVRRGGSDGRRNTPLIDWAHNAVIGKSALLPKRRSLCFALKLRMRRLTMNVVQILDQLESHYGSQKPWWPTEPYQFLIWWHCGYPASDAACQRGWESVKEKQLLLALGEPLLASVGLAFRTMPIPAGVVGDAGAISAVGTVIEMAPRAAVRQRAMARSTLTCGQVNDA